MAIIILTGRQERFSKITKEWLSDNNVIYDLIYMRKDNDNSKDSKVKKTIYEKYIRDNFNIEFILDDRNQVVKMWREELGIKCFQVNFLDF